MFRQIVINHFYDFENRPNTMADRHIYKQYLAQLKELHCKNSSFHNKNSGRCHKQSSVVHYFEPPPIRW
jgi:hypothetical protein